MRILLASVLLTSSLFSAAPASAQIDYFMPPIIWVTAPMPVVWDRPSAKITILAPELSYSVPINATTAITMVSAATPLTARDKSKLDRAIKACSFMESVASTNGMHVYSRAQSIYACAQIRLGARFMRNTMVFIVESEDDSIVVTAPPELNDKAVPAPPEEQLVPNNTTD